MEIIELLLDAFQSSDWMHFEVAWSANKGEEGLEDPNYFALRWEKFFQARNTQAHELSGWGLSKLRSDCYGINLAICIHRVR